MKFEIIETINRFFNAVDKREWDLCSDLMIDKIDLDYTSMSGGEPGLLSKEDILNSWKGFLPGFDSTHHQLGNHEVKINGDSAECFFYGTATHYIVEAKDKIWTVVGTYNAKLRQKNNSWKISALKFNFNYQTGNTNLPELAQERV